MVPSRLEAVEHGADGGMVDRLVGVVGDEVLLADVGDVGRLRVFGEQMVEGLVPGWPDLLGYRVIPFVAVGELRVDIENDAAEVEKAMLDDVANREAGQGHVDLL